MAEGFLSAVYRAKRPRKQLQAIVDCIHVLMASCTVIHIIQDYIQKLGWDSAENQFT